MNLVFCVFGIAGLYFVLNMFHSLHTSIAFTAMGSAISWFAVLMGVGGVLIARFSLGGKK